ncbi:hypothetical protein KI387_028793, partial [Taxus chinensis]
TVSQEMNSIREGPLHDHYEGGLGMNFCKASFGRMGSPLPGDYTQPGNSRAGSVQSNVHRFSNPLHHSLIEGESPADEIQHTEYIHTTIGYIDPEYARTSRLNNSNLLQLLRLMSDLKATRNDPPEVCSASPHSDENLFVWSATIFGPDETPWEGGIFGENYPEKPPRVRFTSDVFHPNVYHDGTLCMDIIQDAWSPFRNVCTILTSIQSLLTDPNIVSPANPEAAQLYQGLVVVDCNI